MAEVHYSFFKGEAGTILCGSNTDSVDHLLALLSKTMGKIDQSIAHFEDALKFCNRVGMRPELAWASYNYADVLFNRNAPGDATKAESLSIAQELDMKPLIERVEELRLKVKTQSSPKSKYPDGLTEREVDVIRLLAVGKSNREIADELFISSRTVGYHIGKILNKTNTANRTEASSYAAHHNLI